MQATQRQGKSRFYVLTSDEPNVESGNRIGLWSEFLFSSWSEVLQAFLWRRRLGAV